MVMSGQKGKTVWHHLFERLKKRTTYYVVLQVVSEESQLGWEIIWLSEAKPPERFQLRVPSVYRIVATRGSDIPSAIQRQFPKGTPIWLRMA